MKSIKFFVGIVLIFFLSVFLITCGGGGEGTTASSNIISGVVSKGPLNGSSVCAYAIASGVMGSQIGSCSTTDSAGNYSINLGTYTGPVLLQATGGTYVDESTGTTITLALPLHSMLPNATGGTVTVAVTPLTELAYQNANALAGGLTSVNIQSAITTVQNNFAVPDIVNTMPVDPLNVPAGATAAQKSYALALATISQYLDGQPTGTTLTNALQTMQTCIAAPTTGCGTGATSVGTELDTALNTFQTAHPAFSGMTLPVINFGSVPQMGTYVTEIANLSNEQVSLPDTVFLTQLSGILTTIDSIPNGPQQFSTYLYDVVLGPNFSSSAVIKSPTMKNVNRVQRSMSIQQVITDIENSPTYQNITGVFDQVIGHIDPAGNILLCAEPSIIDLIFRLKYRTDLDSVCPCDIGGGGSQICSDSCQTAAVQFDNGKYYLALVTAYNGANLPLPTYLAPTNGKCGAANTAVITGAPSSYLCDVGTASTVSGTGPWTWSCAGMAGGTTASCFAQLLSCGAANGGSFSTAPAIAILCATGTPGAVTGGNGSPWLWTCGYPNNPSINCTASYTSPPTCSNGGTNWPTCTPPTCSNGGTNYPTCTPPAAVDGVCGASNWLVLTTQPTSGLCYVGTPSLVSGTGTWTWTCAGANGGITASCFAQLLSCGAANGGSFTTAPPLNLLCTTGLPTAVTGGNGSPWVWNCTGANSTTTSCMASYTSQACNSQQVAGGDTADMRTIELGKYSGTFLFSYDTYSIPDEIIVQYQGQTLYDTGCVGASGSQSISYSGSSTQVTVSVTPNCSGGTSGTAWDYTVACPQ